MNARLAMLAAIHDLPDDDLPRLAYADWMEENGHEPRAEFIRVHLEMERTPKGTLEHRSLWEREVDLIRAHKDDWFGVFRFHWSSYEVKRGFLDEISSAAPHVVPHLGWLLEHHAVQRLVVGSPDLGALADLLASPLVATLRQLRYVHSLTGSAYFSEYGRAELPGASLPLADRPLDVVIRGHRGQAGVAARLARSPHLGRMARLDVSSTDVGEAGARCLLDGMKGWPMLTALVVKDGLGPAGVAALVSSPAVAGLRVLDLTGEALPGVAGPLVASRHLSGLEELHLSRPARGQHALRRRLAAGFGTRIRWAGDAAGSS